MQLSELFGPLTPTFQRAMNDCSCFCNGGAGLVVPSQLLIQEHKEELVGQLRGEGNSPQLERGTADGFRTQEVY